MPNVVSQKLNLTRATKNFLRYDVEEDKADSAFIPSFYIRKEALAGEPKTITVTVKA